MFDLNGNGYCGCGRDGGRVIVAPVGGVAVVLVLVLAGVKSGIGAAPPVVVPKKELEGERDDEEDAPPWGEVEIAAVPVAMAAAAERCARRVDERPERTGWADVGPEDGREPTRGGVTMRGAPLSGRGSGMPEDEWECDTRGGERDRGRAWGRGGDEDEDTVVVEDERRWFFAARVGVNGRWSRERKREERRDSRSSSWNVGWTRYVAERARDPRGCGTEGKVCVSA